MGDECDSVLPDMHLSPNLPRWQRQSYPRPLGRLMQVASGPQASVKVQIEKGHKQEPFLLFTRIILPCSWSILHSLTWLYLSDSEEMNDAGSCCQWILWGSCTYTSWSLTPHTCHHSELHKRRHLNIEESNTQAKYNIYTEWTERNWPGMDDLCKWDSLWHR